MMLYIVYVTVADSHAAAWEQWMREIHIPEVMATGCFTHATFVRDVEATAAGQSFRMTYTARDAAAFEQYQQDFGPALRDDHTSRFGAVTTARRELLPLIAQF